MMSELTVTMGALTGALADVPESAAAWVPLRRATVEAALRHLNNLQTVVDALRYLGYTGDSPHPTANEAPVDVQQAPSPWRYPVMSEEEARQANRTFVADEVHVLRHVEAAVTSVPANGANNDRPTNSWRRKPKTERLAIVRETIGRLATNGWLTQLDFDRRKPEWMPSGSAHVAAFGISWSELVRSAVPAVLTAETPLPDDVVIQVDDDAQLRMAVYEEMRRLAVGDWGPSKTRWDDERSPSLPKSDELIERFGGRWVTLLHEANLLPPGATRSIKEAVVAEATEPFRE